MSEPIITDVEHVGRIMAVQAGDGNLNGTFTVELIGNPPLEPVTEVITLTYTE